MLRYIRIDFRKYFYSKTFWVLFLLYLVLNVIIFSGAEKFVNELVKTTSNGSPMMIPDFSLYSFPHVWHNLSFLGGFLKIFLGLIVIIFITNEFSNKTIRQNVMNGMSRQQFLFSKVSFVFIMSGIATLLLGVTAAVLGWTHTEEISMELIGQKMGFVPAYFLELLTFSSLALMIGFLLKKSGLAIGLLGLYYYIVEPIIAFKLPDSVSQFLPVSSMGNLIDVPNSSLMKMFGVNFREYVSLQDVFVCILYSVVFIMVVSLVLRKSDI